ncbi:ABC transporter substrate-binding protein [Sulfurovum sp. bin170]|uniref:ABC transporter substrate-binding protein n=1 Tax=Sulfurovum sp. bin170 TaxID=2695268 RepID=UPI0013E0D3AC|nr:ABC transporter substrate-binding protein [Sulfurovum sp. bin170]
MFFSLSLQAEERIIALSPSINEIIYALGAGDEMVGNIEYCNYPKKALKIPKVGGYFSPSLEKIIALKPSIVVMESNNYKLSQQLDKLDIKSKIVDIDTLESIKTSIVALGKIFDREKNATDIVGDINSGLDALKNIVKDKKILMVIGHNTSLNRQIFVAGQNLYFDDIIKESGNQNAFQTTRKGQPILNMENIIATNPDIVILLSPYIKEKGLTKKELLEPWKSLPINASKKNSIYIIDKIYAGIPSDRLVYFLEDFREILNDYKINLLQN